MEESWTFLSNHAHILLCLAQSADLRVKEIAVRVGITERAVLRILSDLEVAGVIEKIRMGRRNRYTIHPDVPLRHPMESHKTVGHLMQLI